LVVVRLSSVSSMHILHVVGARPNFMKAAPVLRALGQRSGIRQTLIHTGQHYDANMSDVFFTQLQIPAPDANLEVGSGTQAQQTAEIMSRFEPVLLRYKPDIVVVYGDVNSTMAAALVCAKLQIPVAHVEAGLRSFDRSMPEEINRVVTDHVADYLFTHCDDADRNLEQEGIARDKVHNVGNVMIDSLIRFLPLAEQCKMNGLSGKFALVTLHRPSNVDDRCRLKKILECLIEINRNLQVVFPVHPRTRTAIAGLGLAKSQLQFTDPLPYVDFLSLERRATVVITDSGGIQEETTYLGVPCITLRDNTERPVTVSLGTNVLVGQDTARMQDEIVKVLEGKAKQGTVPPLWDGRASHRIAEVLQKL
jgi:UDP-N-acetylglucosamine 2-epimerase (non-hydrolysing)